MTDEHLELVHAIVKHPFHYVDYPENVTPNWWVDGGGEWRLMSDMGLDHLKACIKKAENDIAYLERSGRPNEVVEAIVPFARQKIKELKIAFRQKADI